MSEQRNGMDEWQDATNRRMAAGNEPDSMAALQAEIEQLRLQINELDGGIAAHEICIANLRTNLEQAVEHGAKGWAEVASLRERLADLQGDLVTSSICVDRLNKQLMNTRKALQEIADHPESKGPTPSDQSSYTVGWAFWNVQCIAKAALTDKEKT